MVVQLKKGNHAPTLIDEAGNEIGLSRLMTAIYWSDNAVGGCLLGINRNDVWVVDTFGFSGLTLDYVGKIQDWSELGAEVTRIFCKDTSIEPQFDPIVRIVRSAGLTYYRHSDKILPLHVQQEFTVIQQKGFGLKAVNEAQWKRTAEEIYQGIRKQEIPCVGYAIAAGLQLIPINRKVGNIAYRWSR